MGFAMSLFDATEWFVLVLWFVAIIAPLLYAARSRTSIAMGITVSVLLGSVVQVSVVHALRVGHGGVLGLERFCSRSRSHRRTFLLAHLGDRRVSSQPRGFDARAWQCHHFGPRRRST